MPAHMGKLEAARAGLVRQQQHVAWLEREQKAGRATVRQLDDEIELMQALGAQVRSLATGEVLPSFAQRKLGLPAQVVPKAAPKTAPARPAAPKAAPAAKLSPAQAAAYRERAAKVKQRLEAGKQGTHRQRFAKARYALLAARAGAILAERAERQVAVERELAVRSIGAEPFAAPAMLRTWVQNYLRD